MERNRELKIDTHIRDRTVHTKEEMQKDRDTESKVGRGDSLVVQWLGLALSLSGPQVPSLVRELRSYKPHGVAKDKQMVGRDCDRCRQPR